MPIPYAEAVAIVRRTAQTKKDFATPREESVQLADALGRRASQDVRSPISTPTFDSSAMDGYAVSSALTQSASTARPLHLRVEGMIAAGDAAISLPGEIDEESGGEIPCVEVMTGATFPRSTRGPEFDACIPWEHTRSLGLGGKGGRVVEIVRPPKPNQHRRFAGDDFRQGELVVRSGEEISPQRIMVTASVGIDTVSVQKRLRAIVMTTGSELQPAGEMSDMTQPRILDCNGPFLKAALMDLGLEVESVAGVADDVDELSVALHKAVSNGACDVLVTTGGVSAGKFDFMPQATQNVHGRVLFHHVAMRPGHPVLCASVPDRGDSSAGDIAVFALPGNPIAAAACYRFLVVPYIRALQGQIDMEPQCRAAVIKDNSATVRDSSSAQCTRDNSNLVCQKDEMLDCFRHGQMQPFDGPDNRVKLSHDQSPAKLKPFGHANCWVHIPRGVSEIRVGDAVDCYPLVRPSPPD